MNDLKAILQFLEQVPLPVRGILGLAALAIAGMYYLAKRPPWWFVAVSALASVILFALAVAGVLADSSGWGKWSSTEARNTRFFMYQLPGVASGFIWIAMARDFRGRVKSAGRRHNIRAAMRSMKAMAKRVKKAVAAWRSARPP